MPSAGQTVKQLVQLPKNPEACWAWLGPVSSSGHGHKTYCGQIVGAHRWMWEQLFGPIPKGMVVFHTCDRKDCVNPHHLRVGSQAEANRQAIGALLTPSDVADIRRHRESRNSATAAVLAQQMGVSPQAIRDIWRGSSWAKPRPNHGPKRVRAKKASVA